MKDRDILLTGDKWTIAVNIALDDYLNLIKGMKFALTQTRRNIELYRSADRSDFDIRREEINQTERLTTELEMDLESVSKVLLEEVPLRHPVSSPDRHKRGLVDLVGYGLKYLFGMADAKDVKGLNAVCDNLHTFQQDAVHATEQQLSFLRILDAATKVNAKNAIDLARALRDSIQNYSLRLGRVEADLIDVKDAIREQSKYSMSIREIELNIFGMKFSLVQ
jgi:hypothetical protein